MKIRILYSLFFITAVVVLFWNASGGPAAVQGLDRTMSPLSNNTSCATCHNSGNYSPSLNVQLLDGEEAITSYMPGMTYTLRVAVTGADDAAGYGFQAVILHGAGNLNAGAFGTAPSGIQVTPLNNRMYAEHNQRSDSNVFTIDWTAPNSGVGDIRIYAGGNAANANGNVSGDQGTFLPNPVVLTESTTTSTDDHLLTFNNLEIAPNPARSGVMLTLDNSRPGTHLMTLFNAMGQRLQTQSLELSQGEQSHWIDLARLPNGLYFLQLSNGRKHLTRKIWKQ